MPEICRFFGIKIYMYFNDHNPAHFHVKYENYRASIMIENLGVLNGTLPPKALSLVIEWASLNKNALIKNWNSLKQTGNFIKIDPLT